MGVALLNIGFVSWVKGVVYGVLLAGMYGSTATYLFLKDWARDDYSYGYMIPLLVLYLIWDKRERLSALPTQPSWVGLFLVLPAFCLFWVGELAGEYFSLYMSLWLMITGLCWLHLGWNKLKEMGFALIMMLTLFPFPNFLYTKVSWQLKIISSQLGVLAMQAFGVSAFREGNVIDLGFTQLQVVDACSGLRYLIPLIVLGLLLSYFYKAAFWKRAFVVVSTIPLSIGTNGLRIALTGVVYEQWGPELAEGVFHDFSGWFIFVVSVGALLLEMWVLQGFKGLGLRSEVGGRRPEGGGRKSEVGGQRSEGLLQARFWVVVVLLGATLGLSHGIEFREKVPISKSFELFPLQVGEWVGTREIMEKRFVTSLDLSDYVIVNYQNTSGRQVNFYVAYYESQRKGESIHTPGTCLPGSGWLFRKAGRLNVAMVNGTSGGFPVNRALMQKGEQHQLVYYWFSQRGRILTNAYQLKFYAFWDALTRQRTDGALVRLITPVYEGETAEQAEKRLQGFMGEIVPVLEGFIPGGGDNGHVSSEL